MTFSIENAFFQSNPLSGCRKTRPGIEGFKQTKNGNFKRKWFFLRGGLSGPLRLRVQSRSRMRLRIAASIAFLFRACFQGVSDTIAPLSRSCPFLRPCYTRQGPAEIVQKYLLWWFSSSHLVRPKKWDDWEIYSTGAVELKTGPIFAFFCLRKWSKFFLFEYLVLPAERGFFKKMKTTRKTKWPNSSVKNWSNRNILGPVFNATLDQL